MLVADCYFSSALCMNEVKLCFLDFFGIKEIDGNSSTSFIYPSLGNRPLSAATWLVRRLEGAKGTKGCVAVASMMPPVLVASIALTKDILIHSQKSFLVGNMAKYPWNPFERQDNTAKCTSSLLSRIRCNKQWKSTSLQKSCFFSFAYLGNQPAKMNKNN